MDNENISNFHAAEYQNTQSSVQDATADTVEVTYAQVNFKPKSARKKLGILKLNLRPEKFFCWRRQEALPELLQKSLEFIQII